MTDELLQAPALTDAIAVQVSPFATHREPAIGTSGEEADRLFRHYSDVVDSHDLRMLLGCVAAIRQCNCLIIEWKGNRITSAILAPLRSALDRLLMPKSCTTSPQTDEPEQFIVDVRFAWDGTPEWRTRVTAEAKDFKAKILGWLSRRDVWYRFFEGIDDHQGRNLQKHEEDARAFLRDHCDHPEVIAALLASEGIDLRSVRDAVDKQIYRVMKERVFGDANPSIAGFNRYLRSLVTTSATYEEKKDHVQTVNFWKAELSAELLHAGQPCTLSITNPGGHGAYQLRRTGKSRRSIYGKSKFPAVICRKLSSAKD